jgi:UDP-GlcNAc:undecaprenyl-phosphate/decaprenyl-phosphate GlcNAc-1-phosphate transferase
MVVCVGAIIAFLKFNVHPSKMFMGDGGSQFAGLIIAFFTIKVLLSG